MRNRLMDPVRWRRVRELVEQLREAPEPVRAAGLEVACGGDPALAAEVRSLLESVDRADAVIDGVVSRAVATLADTAVAGRRVGPYRLVRELGQGGMGAVYLAERADGEFDRQVALKVVRPGLNTEHFMRRFRAERQILAGLQHPHIARLLDGGVDADGQPYFAMEYVEGEPIHRYCQREGLDVDERLALFRDACAAVSYAHANLVIHRDLKPAHILVTADRQIRLLDFGIAKVLSEEADESGGLTQVGIQALTPEYASPEQVRGEAVSTSTDVYSLGVILYELLAGVRPYDFDSRSPAQIERVVCSQDPGRPSTRAGGSEPGLAPHAGRQLRRRLRGDLDVICLKALQKDRARRYASVEALSEDIRRNLAGLPVLARPDSASYRLGKFVTRHRVGVAVTAASLVAFLSLAGYHTVRLARERDRTRLEADKAGQVAGFLRDLFEVSDPSESKGRTITARELLDAGAARLSLELRGQPDVRASMLLVIGDVYRTLGLHDQARALLTEALDEHRRLLPGDDERLAENLAALGSVLQDMGDVESAEPLFRESLAMRQRLLGPRHALIAESLELLAFLRESRSDLEEAERLNREAVAMNRALFPPGNLRLAHSVAKLAGLLRRSDRGTEAEPLLREALAAQLAALGPDDLTVASTKRNLAALLRDKGALDEAETLLREVVDTRRRILGDEHTETGVALNSLALLLDRKGDTEGAIRTYQEFLAVLEHVHGGRPHADLAAAYNNLGASLRDAGRFDEAIVMYRRSIQTVDAVLAPSHPNRAFARVGLAIAYADQGQFTPAEPLLREALAIRRKALAPGHRSIGDTLVELGVCLTGLKRFAEAEKYLREALALFSDGPGQDATRAARAQSRLDRLVVARGG